MNTHIVYSKNSARSQALNHRKATVIGSWVAH